MKNVNKSTERAGGNNSSEGNSNSNENKSQDSKIKGLPLGAGEKKSTFMQKNALGTPLGVRAFKPLPKKGISSKLKTQSSAMLAKRVHKKNILANPQGHLITVPILGQS